MDNKSAVIKSFDEISGLGAKKWSHNNHYHKNLIKLLKGKKGCEILDLGCGKGGLCFELSELGHNVMGIDFSPEMINEAKKKIVQVGNKERKLNFINADAYAFIPSLNDNSIDAVFSVAAMHHMNYDKIISLLKGKIKKGGIFAVIDIYESKTAADYLTCGLAVIPSIIINKLKNGRARPSAEERRIWDEHGKLDIYPILSQLRQNFDGKGMKYKLKRLLFFRYLLVIEF